MSVKKLFDKSKKTRPVVKKPNKRLNADVESEDFMEAKAETQQTFDPHVVYGITPVEMQNFVKYGSAKRYYNDSFSRIYTTYPYDGSGAEKLEFHNSSSYLDKWIYDTRYPTSTGYVNFNAAPNNTWTAKYNPATKEYISFQCFVYYQN